MATKTWVSRRMPSEDFSGAISDASKQIWLDWEKASRLRHKGLKGKGRELPVETFLSQRLPKTFSVVNGEALDRFGRRTGELDLMVFDAGRNAPLIQSYSQGGTKGSALLPAEALLCVIEVKSILTRTELEHCYAAAALVRSLRPFGKRFVGPRSAGAPANDHNHRCMYLIFAYSSDLSADDWIKKEWKRLTEVAAGQKVDPTVIDRVLVLDRGLIDPAHKMGKVSEQKGEDTFFDWYLHLSNFAARENARRPQIDWQYYGGKISPGWTRME